MDKHVYVFSLYNMVHGHTEGLTYVATWLSYFTYLSILYVVQTLRNNAAICKWEGALYFICSCYPCGCPPNSLTALYNSSLECTPLPHTSVFTQPFPMPPSPSFEYVLVLLGRKVSARFPGGINLYVSGPRQGVCIMSSGVRHEPCH